MPENTMIKRIRIRVTRNGQTTIPYALRQKYGIKEGTTLIAEDTDSGILLTIPTWIDADVGTGNYRLDEMKRKLDNEREIWR